MTRHSRSTEAMSEVLRLTRAGKLAEATALIQRTLGQGGAAVPPAAEDVVDGSFTRVEEAAAAADAPGKRPARRRAPLGETLRSIAAGGMPTRDPLTDTAPGVAPGARFDSRTHRGKAGRRDYRLYVPATDAGVARPVVVMLHGCTQTPEDFALGTGMNAVAEEFGCIVVYPEQPSGANMNKCWNWFRPEDQARGGGEPALLAQLTKEVIAETGADPARVYVAGLSAGGAAAATLAAAYPEVFSAVGVHSGLPLGAAHDVPSAFAAMRAGAADAGQGTAVPTISFHGLADTTVHPDNGRQVVEQALRGRSDLKIVKAKGRKTPGRGYRRTRHEAADGRSIVEHWEIEGAPHAWSGGNGAGSFTDPKGPDASREMMRFFLQHEGGARRRPA